MRIFVLVAIITFVVMLMESSALWIVWLPIAGFLLLCGVIGAVRTSFK